MDLFDEFINRLLIELDAVDRLNTIFNRRRFIFLRLSTYNTATSTIIKISVETTPNIINNKVLEGRMESKIA